jgi:CHASE2 domain-containing sensor protein
VVVIRFDDAAMRRYGNWPWPRSLQAELADKLTAVGAKHIYFDLNFSFPSKPSDDAAFAAALEQSGKATLAARFKTGASNGTKVNSPTLPLFAKHAACDAQRRI